MELSEKPRKGARARLNGRRAKFRRSWCQDGAKGRWCTTYQPDMGFIRKPRCAIGFPEDLGGFLGRAAAGSGGVEHGDGGHGGGDGGRRALVLATLQPYGERLAYVQDPGDNIWYIATPLPPRVVG